MPIVTPSININISRNDKNLNILAFNINLVDFCHVRFAHIGKNLILNISETKSAIGVPALKFSKTFCKPCQYSKQKRISFKPLGEKQTKLPLDKLHLDVWGPISIKGRGSERFYMSIIDDYPRKIAIYPMKNKSQMYNIFMRHVTKDENRLAEN